MKHLVLTLAVVCLAALAAGSADAALIAYEGFDYSASHSAIASGTLSGGFGWTNNWITVGFNASNYYEVAPGSLGAPFPTTGNRVAGYSTADDPPAGNSYPAHLKLRRTFDTSPANPNYSDFSFVLDGNDELGVAGTSVWFSFLADSDGIPNNAYSGVNLFGIFTGELAGKNDPDAIEGAWSLYKSKSNANSVPLPKGDVADLHQIVVRYDFVAGSGNDVGNIWLDPDRDMLLANALTPDQTITGFDFSTASNQWEFASAQSFTFDEIYVGTAACDVVPVPEPGVMMLLATGLTAVYGLRRRRA
jgi:hypothetical protein